jgi:hypothetical protein
MNFSAAPAALEGMGIELHGDDLGAAIALGWRVAELYSLVDDPGKCSEDTLLPAHGSLAPADQLELQLGTAAGFARRAGVECDPADGLHRGHARLMGRRRHRIVLPRPRSLRR